jgi:endonuclease YncB( thermonuclease family)
MKFLCFSICGSDIPTPDYFDDIQPFVPPINEGHVIKVYDGDTITIVSKLPYSGSPKYKFSVRLAGIDSAEMSSKNVKAIEARDALSSKIMGKQVTLKNVKTEKYGRILADVHLDGMNLN